MVAMATLPNMLCGGTYNYKQHAAQFDQEVFCPASNGGSFTFEQHKYSYAGQHNLDEQGKLWTQFLCVIFTPSKGRHHYNTDLLCSNVPAETLVVVVVPFKEVEAYAAK